MNLQKPFHRCYRPVKNGPNRHYSSWAYIEHKEYAQNPEHYTRAFSIIQEDLLNLFQFVEPADINEKTYSFRIHELLIRICIEIEANFKAILKENIFAPVITRGNKKGQPRSEGKWNINDYYRIKITHYLDDYTVSLPFWKGSNNIRTPFKNWNKGGTLAWYEAYNKSKHDRLNSFEKANFMNLIDAFSGLFILLSAQFFYISFSPGGSSIGTRSSEYFTGEFGIGGFLIVNYPSWPEEVKYDFDWSDLNKEKIKFNKIDYNQIKG